eukprot:CAMPEP_0115151874 /NCGR_PEP_ID=MMETSP0227-20121206/65847_1 /TAXON_ID=89957 /ORGANISM="Polarella glacialis, Strain CCMP 1383" /LENGTH=162 /DNA_ID=CAMNT_0002562419 /DNA_START=661 /DNA_END=1150 /DNA_ORIENTATION=-
MDQLAVRCHRQRRQRHRPMPQQRACAEDQRYAAARSQVLPQTLVKDALTPSDSSRDPVWSLRKSLFNDESEVFSSLADLRPRSEGFSCSFSVPAKSTSVRAPMLLGIIPPSLTSDAGFCTNKWTTACDLDEFMLQDEIPAVRLTAASCSRLKHVSMHPTRTI